MLFVNSLIAHKMIKKSLIEAYNSNHKYDFVRISENYLDSSVSDDDKELAMEGYNLAMLKKVMLVFTTKNQ